MGRKNIAYAIVENIYWRSNRLCCICGKLGKHIHHIDGNRDNNNEENLVLLCFDDHDEAERQPGGLGRKTLTKEYLTRTRDFHYRKIEAKREVMSRETERVHIDEKKMYDVLFVRDMHRKCLDEFSDKEWKTYERFLAWVSAQLSYDLGSFAREQILEELYSISISTRVGMPESLAFDIMGLTIHVASLHSNWLISKNPELTNPSILLAAANIGSQLVYDGALYLNNYRIISYGSEILSKVLRVCKINGVNELDDHMSIAYQIALDGASRSCLSEAVSYVSFEKEWAENEASSFLIEYPSTLKTIAENKWPDG